MTRSESRFFTALFIIISPILFIVMLFMGMMQFHDLTKSHYKERWK